MRMVKFKPEVDELTERTQRIVEGAHFSMREYNLKLDDVINDQRESSTHFAIEY